MPLNMTVRHSKASPFCRKVDIVAKHHKLDGFIAHVDANVLSATDSLRDENPLGKIPVLVLENGDNIYDSSVIVDYFEQIGKGQSLIPKATARVKILTGQALATGIVEAAVSVVYEGRLRKPENFDQGFVDYQLAKIERGLTRASQTLPSLHNLNLENIMTAVMLEYLDLRINEDRKNGTELGNNKGMWRSSHSGFAKWLTDFYELCPYFGESRPY